MKGFILFLIVNLAVGNNTSSDNEKLKDALRNNRTSRNRNQTENAKGILQTQAINKLRECGVQTNGSNENHESGSTYPNYYAYGNNYGSSDSNSNSQNRYGSTQANNRPQRNYNGDSGGNNSGNQGNRRNFNKQDNGNSYETNSDGGDDANDRYDGGSRRTSYENSHFGVSANQNPNYSKMYPYGTSRNHNNRGSDLGYEDRSNQNGNNDRTNNRNNRYNGSGSWGSSSGGARTNYGYRSSGNSGMQNSDRDEHFGSGYTGGGDPYKNQWYGANGNVGGEFRGGNSGANFNSNPYGGNDDCDDDDGQNRENNGGYGYLHGHHSSPIMRNLLKSTRKKRYSFGLHKTSKSSNNDQCISQCVFAHLEILDDYRSPSETMFAKWIQDHYKDSDADRIDTLRRVRRCFARLTSTDIEDGCEFSTLLSECLNLSLEN